MMDAEKQEDQQVSNEQTEEQSEPDEAVQRAEIDEILEEEETTEETTKSTAESEAEQPLKPAEEERPKIEEPKERAREEEEEVVEERFYTVPLSKAWIMPPRKRAPRAMRILKSFIRKHMKIDARPLAEGEEEARRLVITNKVNLKLWSRGIEKPPRKIRVRAAKDKEGNVTVHLAEGE